VATALAASVALAAAMSGDAPKPASSRAFEFKYTVRSEDLIARLAREQTKGLDRRLDKARAIYDYVPSIMRYDKTGEGWGRGDAIYACNVKKGNCTDFHALFIGMARAAGIPARFEIGFPLPRDRMTRTGSSSPADATSASTRRSRATR